MHWVNLPIGCSIWLIVIQSMGKKILLPLFFQGQLHRLVVCDVLDDWPLGPWNRKENMTWSYECPAINWQPNLLSWFFIPVVALKRTTLTRRVKQTHSGWYTKLRITLVKMDKHRLKTRQNHGKKRCKILWNVVWTRFLAEGHSADVAATIKDCTSTWVVQQWLTWEVINITWVATKIMPESAP